MSRQIRFRSWDLDYKWMEDNFYLHSSGTSYDNPSRTYDTPNIEIDENPNLIVMQFTGLLDKNGKEIYEGDIVAEWDVQDGYTSFIGKVVFTEGRWVVFGKNCSEDLFDFHLDVEVIGNIYENPEMLEEN
jgi:uncharacterized phage protein (TIGR01671 family)